MSYLNSESDTICAVATPAGVSGIGVIRLSGNQARAIFKKLAHFFPESPDSHRAYYGFLKSPAGSEALDEVIATFFAEGRSFTGQDTIEISCHGSSSILKQVLAALVVAGARVARPGEFSYRAFSSGRIDLAQAEAVLDLIESQNSRQSKNALRQLKGDYSEALTMTLNEITKWSAHIEADIDFSENELETLSRTEISAGILATIEKLELFLATANYGKFLREGYRVLLTGSPNVGKSSLLNAILAEDRAIVTESPGTTRDLVESWIEVAGVRVSITDSAGLRDSKDNAEKIGIQRARQAALNSDLVFYVVECGRELSESERAELFEIKRALGPLVLILANKSDMGTSPSSVDVDLRVSAKNSAEAQKIILQEIERKLQQSGSSNEIVITRARHVESIQKMLTSLKDAQTSLSANLSLELVSLGLKEALTELHSLLGSRLDEQVIDRVFKEFCLGK